MGNKMENVLNCLHAGDSIEYRGFNILYCLKSFFMIEENGQLLTNEPVEFEK